MRIVVPARNPSNMAAKKEELGVLLPPLVDKRGANRSSTEVGKAVFSNAMRPVDADLADEAQQKWSRFGAPAAQI